MKEPKILLFDVETAPSLGYFWEMYDTNIISIKEHGYMLSFSAKWLGQKKVMSFALPDFPGYKKNMCDDKKLLMKLSELLDEADIVVAHNGDRFDIVTTNTRLISNGLTPPSPFKTVDTLTLARRKFRFPSNKLDSLGQYLGVGRKMTHTGKHLWFAVMAGDKKAWAKMKAYNVQDVRLLESIYLKLRPWSTTHPNVNLWTREDGCPHCGSENLHSRGTEPVVGGSRPKYQCQDCGHWSRGRVERKPAVVVQ